MRGAVQATQHGKRGLTLIELAMVLAVLLVLAALAVPSFLNATTRAKIASSFANQRSLSTAIEAYRLDNGDYPAARSGPGDPFGVVAKSALTGLTTPIAYISPAAFEDPFGSLRAQTPNYTGGSFSGVYSFKRGLIPPRFGFDMNNSLLYFDYSYLSDSLGRPAMNQEGWGVVSIGPDHKDSFMLYYPFPAELPAAAGGYGIHSHVDTIYDPTNGVVSDGDFGTFGGALAVPRLVGGGVE